MNSEGSNKTNVIEDCNRTEDKPAVVRSPLEDTIIASAKKISGDIEQKWMDARGQSGPSPADLGEHEPIPDEAIAMVAVESKTFKTKVRADGDTFFPSPGKE